MALTNKSADGDSAVDTGAEFEENNVSQKVEVKTRARATKPTITGSDQSTEIEGESKKAMASKSKSLTPDISKDEAKPAETPSRQTVDELAEVAADKKGDNDRTAQDMAQQKAEALIENKTYFVPIGQVTKRRNSKIIALLCVVLFVVAAVVLFRMA